MTEVPILTTHRLILREHRAEDLDDVMSIWGDPRVVRHIGGKTLGRDECWNRILRYAGLWRIVGYGYWVITDRETGAFLGEAGVADFKRNLTPNIEGMPEAGWALNDAAKGRGVATEAVQAILAWVDTELKAETTVCMIDADNLASIRVAEKCGFAKWTDTTFHDSPVGLYRRTRSPGSADR